MKVEPFFVSRNLEGLIVSPSKIVTVGVESLHLFVSRFTVNAQRRWRTRRPGKDANAIREDARLEMFS